MRVLVACEFSGTVRDAFRKRGHDAWSCDLLPSDSDPAYHLRGDVRRFLDSAPDDRPWDLMIGHPPCTHLAVSGAAWFKDKAELQEAALDFVSRLMCAPIPMIAIENPVSVISTRIRKPDQVIHPWQFGHMEQKTTCLWLKGLAPLRPTKNVYREMMELPKNVRERIHYLPPSEDRWAERSKTFQGIADAMASQWGGEQGALAYA